MDSPPVRITFDCLPLRSVGRLDIPLDATEEFTAFCERVTAAIKKHGLHNTYYLHQAECVYHLTNRPEVGMLRFTFEGVVLTDVEDRKTLAADLSIRLANETCDWLTESIVGWFEETIERAVTVEFDRFIEVGDLERTLERIEREQAESDSHGGFLGMGL